MEKKSICKKDEFYTPCGVEPLISHLPKKFAFAEPCCGDGALVNIKLWRGWLVFWA